MKLEMTTNWLPLVQPGLYGTWLGDMYNNIHEDYTTDFKNQLCFEAQSIMNEIFSRDSFVERFGNYTVSNVKLVSPRFYNYENDSIEFDLEIEKPELIEKLWSEFEPWDYEAFFEFAKKNYGSRSGFISFFPYESNAFEMALLYTEPNKNGRYDYNRAVTMLLMFDFEQSKCDLDSYQKDLEANMEEYCSANGLYDYEEEDE